MYIYMNLIYNLISFHTWFFLMDFIFVNILDLKTLVMSNVSFVKKCKYNFSNRGTKRPICLCVTRSKKTAHVVLLSLYYK